MPSFEASARNLERLCRGKFRESDLEYAKAELDGVEGDVLKLKSADTNRPDLWSEEGVARVIRGIHGISKGLPKFTVRKGAKRIIVGSSVSEVRPYISGFIADGFKVTDDTLRSMIGMQENLSENYGRKRQRIAIGIYSHQKIKFPLKYDAVVPESVKFTPLDFDEKINMREILRKHPKGVKYAGLLEGKSRFPLLSDAKGEVLSFPPVINSNTLGKVEPGEASLFIEVTGPDQKQVMLVSNILAQAFHDSGARIESVASVYPYKTRMGSEVQSPNPEPKVMSFHLKSVEQMIGINPAKDEAIRLLEKMQYGAKCSAGKITVSIPCYRADIMHPVDIIEDMAIAYGYNNFEPAEMKSFTAGGLSKITLFNRKLAYVMAGLGFQEIVSPVLTGKSTAEKMNVKDDVIEIENPMTETYSAIRSSVLPSLLNCVSKNKHVECPQKIFEIGECAMKLIARDAVRVAGCIANSRVSFEDISSVACALVRSMGFEYKIQPASDSRFLEGRSATISVGGTKIGIMGEINPKVLNNWGIENPVVAFELSADKLMEKL